LGIGLAPFLLNFCACIVVLLINNGLKNYGGDYYVGAYGIANRVLFVFIMIVNGINQGMQPIVGYNYGAGQTDRSISAYTTAVFAASVVMIICWLACMIVPEHIVSLFTDDVSLIEITSRAIRIAVSVFPFVGFQIVSTGLFMSMGMAHKSIFLSTTRQLLFLIPFLIILPNYFGTDGIWMSMPISDAISCIVVAVMVALQMRKFKKQRQ
jgi:Na+-driven multidrug efflux pump